MIIDVHTHTPQYKDVVPEEEIVFDTVARPDRAVKRPVNWSEYMQAMEPVDKAIVFGIAREGHNPNDATAAFANAYSHKLIGFLSVNPNESDCLDEIARGVFDLGLKGIKLGPNYQNFDPLGEPAFRVYQRAEEMGLPIVFHTGTSPVRTADLDYAHPRHFDRIAIAFPQLHIILAHMAHPWQISTIAVIRKHPHVYADISALFYRPWSFYQEWRVSRWSTAGPAARRGTS
ncbi:MAG: amidohydrolase family protein [Anaerolineae bacterium]|nr:amidohydrolase family protein [Anaerolineae bacterium]